MGRGFGNYQRLTVKDDVVINNPYFILWVRGNIEEFK